MLPADFIDHSTAKEEADVVPEGTTSDQPSDSEYEDLINTLVLGQRGRNVEYLFEPNDVRRWVVEADFFDRVSHLAGNPTLKEVHGVAALGGHTTVLIKTARQDESFEVIVVPSELVTDEAPNYAQMHAEFQRQLYGTDQKTPHPGAYANLRAEAAGVRATIDGYWERVARYTDALRKEGTHGDGYRLAGPGVNVADKSRALRDQMSRLVAAGVRQHALMAVLDDHDVYGRPQTLRDLYVQIEPLGVALRIVTEASVRSKETLHLDRLASCLRLLQQDHGIKTVKALFTRAAREERYQVTVKSLKGKPYEALSQSQKEEWDRLAHDGYHKSMRLALEALRLEFIQNGIPAQKTLGIETARDYAVQMMELINISKKA